MVYQLKKSKTAAEIRCFKEDNNWLAQFCYLEYVKGACAFLLFYNSYIFVHYMYLMSAELINKISAKIFACLSETSALWSFNLYARYCLEVNIKLPSWFAILGFPVRIASLHPPKVFGYLAQTLGKMLSAAKLVACEYSSLSCFAKETSAPQRQKFDTDDV